MTKVKCYISYPEGGCEDVGEIVFYRHTLISHKELKALKDRITELEAVIDHMGAPKLLTGGVCES